LRNLLGIRDEFDPTSTRINILYARVSKRKDGKNLETQINYVKENFDGKIDRVITDIGSGVNFERDGFVSILDAVETGNVANVVVADKNRFTCIGESIIERICRKYGTSLYVVQCDDDAQLKYAEDDTPDDLFDVCRLIMAKNSGKRKFN